MEHPTLFTPRKAGQLFTAFCIIILLFPLTLSAQTQLVSIDAETANMEASAQAPSFGFAKVYVSADDLRSLLSTEGSNGVRFYTAIPESAASPTIIAAAVTENGVELGMYIRMDGMSSRISAEEARADVGRSKESELSTLAARVTSADLMSKLMKEGADGIHIKPGNGGFIMIAAQSGEEGTGDFGTEYMKHAEPCPPLCDDNTLIRLD